MVAVLSGAIIISDNGSSARYKEKCESCGYVGNSTKNINSNGNGNSTFSSSFSCPKCRNRQAIKIQH